MNIFKEILIGRHFPSDLRKLPGYAAKACLLSEIFSVFGDQLIIFHHIKGITLTFPFGIGTNINLLPTLLLYLCLGVQLCLAAIAPLILL